MYILELPPVLWEGDDGYKHGRSAEDRRLPAGAEAPTQTALCSGAFGGSDPGSGKELWVSLVRKGLQQWVGRGGGKEELRAL